MMNLFIEYKSIFVIAIIMILLVVIYILLHSRFKKQVAGFLLDLVIEAENHYGSGTGKAKLSYASGIIYKRLPAIAKLVLSQKEIEKIITKGAAELEEYLKTMKISDQVKLISTVTSK